MAELTDDLLHRIRQRAADPARRYMTAAEDEAKVELPADEIERRLGDWHARNRERGRDAAIRDGMAPEEFDRNAEKDLGNQIDPWRMVEEQMRAWGQAPPKKMSFSESDDHIGWSTEPPGARPLAAPPTEADWAKLEGIAGRPMPDDLRKLYSIANGGFGPGFTGLNELHLVGSFCEDFRRRGPDYCGTIGYPASFIPIAGEMLDYHYDLDTGRIISSNQNWFNEGLEAEDIYDIAFQDLAAMMEDWLQRS